MSETNEYGILVNLWTSGRRDYHNLTGIYVTGNSLLLNAIAFMINSLRDGNNIYLAIIIIPISFLGIWLCFNLKIAQERLSTQNAYWERELRIFENITKKQISRSRFKALLNFRGIPKEIKAEHGEREFKLSPWVCEYKKFRARRMKLFPLIFGLIYGFIILFCIIYIQLNFALTPIMQTCYVTYLLGFFIGGLIMFFLRPEEYVSSLTETSDSTRKDKCREILKKSQNN